MHRKRREIVLVKVTLKFSLPIADKYVIATKNEICTKRIYELKKYNNTNTTTNTNIVNFDLRMMSMGDCQ